MALPLVAQRALEKLGRAQGVLGLVFRTATTADPTTDPTDAAGAGAPTLAEPNGSTFRRTDGAASTTFYVRASAAWSALASAASVTTVSDALATLISDLASTAVSKGASLIGIYDVATQITATTVEGALAEIVDTIQQLVVDLASVANAKGASLIGIEDSGNIITGVTVEAALAENRTRLNTYQDQLVTATVTVPDTSGGGTDALSTVAIRRAYDAATPPATICQVLLLACDAQYEPIGSVSLSATTTFATATTGTIVASGNGWALIATDAAGDFACTIANSADETLYFRCITAEAVSNAGQRCVVVSSNSDSATWAP